jgi:glycosyltransferase involved in cell wall biosynthesis
MSPPPVSVVTVIRDGRFFIRLLVEQVRRTVGDRDYEIVVVDQGSHDGSRAWLAAQPDVQLLRHRRWLRRGHCHNEAEVIRETAGQVSRARYPDPLVARPRAAYCLDD